MDDYGILIFAGIILFVVLGIGWSFFAEKKRREAIGEMAEELGLTYTPNEDSVLRSSLEGFKLFNTGRSRKMYNVLSGDSGEVTLAIFDYKYTTGSGKNSQTHLQTVIAIQSQELNCPAFRMRPENIFDRVGSALGFQDIDFDEYPEFSKLFVLQGSNETAIRSFFTADLARFFESKKGHCVEAQAGCMLFYKSGKRRKPDQLKDLLAEGYEVFGMIADAQSVA